MGSLEQYLIVEPGRACVAAWRRTAERFVREVFLGLESVISLPTLDAELSLGEIYEEIVFRSPAA